MAENHTPGRLTVYDYQLWMADQPALLVATVGGDMARSTDRANARRLCAAWNAVEGISTAALEGEVVRELADALKAALPLVGLLGAKMNGPDEVIETLAAIRTVLAKVKGR